MGPRGPEGGPRALRDSALCADTGGGEDQHQYAEGLTTRPLALVA